MYPAALQPCRHDDVLATGNVESVDCTSQLFPPTSAPRVFLLGPIEATAVVTSAITIGHTHIHRRVRCSHVHVERMGGSPLPTANYNYSDSSVTLSRRALQFFVNYGLSRIRFLLRVRMHLPSLSLSLSLSLIIIGHRALIKRAPSRFFPSSRSVGPAIVTIHLAMKNYTSRTRVFPLSLYAR